MAVTLKVAVLQDVTPSTCNLLDRNQSLGGRLVPVYQPTWHCFLEDSKLCRDE